MRNYEKEINFNKMDIERGVSKAEKTMKEYEINPEDFVGEEGYVEEDIIKDQAYVKKMEGKFEEGETHEGHQLGKILEAIFHEHAELSEWLGSNVETIKTSRFDDIVNGVDLIAEFTGDEETSHLGLAIDATLNNSVKKKLARIKDEIDTGYLAEIKYFYSEELGVREPKKDLPRVVLTATAETIKELNDLWLEGKNRELGRHKIQYQILQEIIIQLKTFRDYAEKKGGLEHLVKIYQTDLDIVEDIYKEKESGAEKDDKDFYEYDSMFDLLKNSLKYFGKEKK